MTRDLPSRVGEEQKEKIRRLKAAGLSNAEIAERFGLKKTYVQDIVYNPHKRGRYKKKEPPNGP